jgi:hypothetical protein
MESLNVVKKLLHCVSVGGSGALITFWKGLMSSMLVSSLDVCVSLGFSNVDFHHLTSLTFEEHSNVVGDCKILRIVGHFFVSLTSKGVVGSSQHVIF